MKRLLTAFFLTLATMTALRAAEPEKPVVYMVADAHLDTQWRWDVQTTINEYVFSTLVQNFALIDAYPGYIFNFEGAVKYAWAKEYYPELFEKLKGYVASGAWHISGASWDANDPNMPSIESFIRNIMLGQRFYREEFGVLSTDIMLPDCFGFGWHLPSVAAHCGLIGFGTQKLAWRQNPFYENGMKFPFHFGKWQGPDGATIMAAMDGGNYSWSPKEPITDWPDFNKVFEYSFIPAIYRYFGTGDRGGSPTPQGLRFVADAVKNPGPNYRVRFAASDDMFKDFKDDPRLETYDGELLMDVHATGCYSSKAEMKNLNRRNEWMLGSAESAAVIADWLGGVKYPSYMIDNGWKRILWHQFHDDLTGTSIPEAYRYSYNDEYLTLSQMNAVVETSVASASKALDTSAKGCPVVVYNPISTVNGTVAAVDVNLPAGSRGADVYGPDGKKVKSQILSAADCRTKVLFAAGDPSLGLAVYDVRPSKKAPARSSALKLSPRSIENRIYKVTLDDNGDICSIVDKRCGRELVHEGETFGLQFFPNNESYHWPAWEIIKDVMDAAPEKVCSDVKIEAGGCGPLRASIKVERKWAGSTFTQEIVLTDGAADDRIDIVNTIDWQSRAALLKAAFPVSFDAPKAVYDLGMCTIERGNNTKTAYEVPAHQWADMTSTDGSYGVTVMNDAKYGWDKPDDHTIRLTLMHTPGTKNGYKEQSTQDHGVHTFTYSIVGHPGALVTSKADIDADCLNQPKMAFVPDSHKGALGRSFSMASSTNPSLRIKAFKKAQDGDGVVVRVYELSGKGASGRLVFGSDIVSAEELDGIEDPKGPATFAGRSLEVSSSRFALRTFRVRFKEAPAKVGVPSYENLKDLPFNVVAFTTDDFTTQGRLGSGRESFAAELLPEVLEYRGVPFVFGEANYPDAVCCDGQTISLPAGTRTLHLLAAAAPKEGDSVAASFKIGPKAWNTEVSAFSGLFGVYGWPGYYETVHRTDDVAYIGTHTHKFGVRNEAAVCSYMYLLSIPVDGATEIQLPEGKNVFVFSATAEK